MSRQRVRRRGRVLLLPLATLVAACIEPTTPIGLGGGGGGGALPGSLEVTVTTTGAHPDPNGYQLVLNESTSQSVEPNGTATFGGLAPGAYEVTLLDLDGACTVQGGSASRNFTITENATTQVAYAIDCP